MKIYIDAEYKCHTEQSAEYRDIETDFFDGKCRIFIEGYRFIPDGEEWTRDDGTVFKGEMIAPWKVHTLLQTAQEAYEQSKNEDEELFKIISGEVSIDEQS